MKVRKIFQLLFLLLVSTTFAEVTFTSPSLLGAEGTHRTHSANTLGKSRLVFGVSGRGAYDKDKLVGGGVARMQVGYDKDKMIPMDKAVDTTAVDELFDLTARIFATIGISDYFDLGISMPIHADWLTGMSVKENSVLRRASSTGPGDIEIIGKLQYPPYEHYGPYEMAFMGILTLPTGDSTKGFVPKETYYIPKSNSASTRFYSAHLPTMALLWLNTLDFSKINPHTQVQWHLNLGLHTTSSPILDNSFLLNTSVVWKPSSNILALFLEFSGATRTSNFANGFKLGDDPLFLSPGFIVNAENGITLSLAMDWGISRGKQYETLRLDPNPGPKSGDPLCPNCDGDGEYYSYKVKPVADLGMSATLSWSGFLIKPQPKVEPPPRVIHDTVYDTIVQIQYDTIVRVDTLVQIQTDTLTQVDTLVQVFQDTLVKVDTLVQIQTDTLVQKDTLVIEKKAKVVMHGVTFATGSAELTPESFVKLDEVARTMRNSPDVILEISGHTDNRGSNAINQRISTQRAESVVRYLIAQGVPGKQLRSIGYGSSRPIASNKTAEGRERNRRIEMMRIQ